MSATTSPRAMDSEPVPVGVALPAYQKVLARLLSFVLFLSAAYVSFYPKFSGQPWMFYVEDDFFYYLSTAIHLAHGAGSTWNGIVPTNGYHPLWLALLTLEQFFFHSEGALVSFLGVVILSATAATYLLACRLLGEHSRNPLLINALAAYIALYAMHLFNTGMEVILTIPLLLAVAWAYQRGLPWRAHWTGPVGFGLLLSALCLSRLDTIIFVGLLAGATLLHPGLRGQLSAGRLVGVGAGLLPLVLYFVSNQLLFHTWLPVSGMAKQLKGDHLPSSAPWHSLLIKGPVTLLTAGLILSAIALLPSLIRRLRAPQQVLYPVVLVFPFLYLFILSCTSDWQLWDWYFYSLRTALCISFAVFLLWRPSSRLLHTQAVSVALCLFLFAEILLNRRSVAGAGGPEIYQAADNIRAFAKTHPGRYAMGDRSGMVGYLLPDSVVQTEGLVMDRAFLEQIRQRAPLRQALAKYDVSFYVATTRVPYQGCFHAAEPAQAGPTSAQMVAAFCAPPVASWKIGAWQTLIFDLKQP